MPGTFVIRNTVTPLYYGVLKTAQGDTLIRTQMHRKKSDCLADIDMMKHDQALEDLVSCRQNAGGAHYLLLIDKNSRIVAFSEEVATHEALLELLTEVLHSIACASVME